MSSLLEQWMRQNSARYAAFLELVELGDVHHNGLLHHRDREEKRRFELLVQYQKLKRKHDKVLGAGSPHSEGDGEHYSTWLYEQLTLVGKQLIILREVNRRIVFGCGAIVRADYTERIGELEQMQASLARRVRHAVYEQPGMAV